MRVTRVDALTADQSRALVPWAERWNAIAHRTGPADRAAFEGALRAAYRHARAAYRHAGMREPTSIVWVGSPREVGTAPHTSWPWLGEEVEAVLERRVGADAAEALESRLVDAVDSPVGTWVEGALVEGWIATPDVAAAALSSFLRVICRLRLDPGGWEHARALEMLAESGCLWRRDAGEVIACGPPSELHTEAVAGDGPVPWHRLHREDGPALAWPRGTAVHAIHGVVVPRRVVEAPETLAVGDIAGERDTEVRRVMVERYGAGRFVREAGARRIDEDREWGTLWQAAGGEEPLTMVECVNATPERDGSFRHYWLHVPPWMGTAREAIAWTFELRADEYAPVAQS